MSILAIMGSPRKGGNSDLLLDEFLRGVEEGGGEFEKLSVGDLKISPCREILACEKDGECVIKDDMNSVYEKLLEAEKIVIAAPIFFYGFPAHFKALIDRCQVLWVRKHLLGVEPAGGSRRAFALLLGATKGERLFDGVLLTLRYFLEPLNAGLAGTLLYRKVEKKGDIRNHPTAMKEAYQAGMEFGRE